jgi:hypothetical protein
MVKQGDRPLAVEGFFGCQIVRGLDLHSRLGGREVERMEGMPTTPFLSVVFVVFIGQEIF